MWKNANGRAHGRWYVAALTVAYCGLIGLVSSGVLNDAGPPVWVGPLGQAAAPLATLGALGRLVLWQALRRRTMRRVGDVTSLQAGRALRPRRGPILLGLGIIAWSLGRAATACMGTAPAPPGALPWPDLFGLAAYGILLPGLIVTLLAGPIMSISRLRILVDSLMVMAAIATLGWYALVGPIVIHGHEPLLRIAIGVAYPFCDLMLATALLVLAGQPAHSARPALIPLLAGAVTSLIIADSAALVRGIHTASLLAACGQTAGYTLLALAVWAASNGTVRFVVPGANLVSRLAYADLDDTFGAWRALLAYLCLPAIGFVALDVLHGGNGERLRAGVLAGSAVLFGLALLRQALALLENNKLHSHLRAAYGQLEARNRDMRAHAQDVENLNRELRLMHDALERNNQALTAANRRLETLATTDPLTGLPNHRALVDALDGEMERARRYRRPCAVLFFDLDHFKALNDTYGHQAGDTALVEFATAVRSALRGVDAIGRWGGEEFVAILPETGGDAARQAAEHVRAAVAAHPFSIGGGARLTCSIGVAAYPIHATDRDGLIRAADRAMYASKHLGRDQVRMANDPVIATMARERDGGTSREDIALAGTVQALTALIALREHGAEHHVPDLAPLTIRVANVMGLDTGDARMIGLVSQIHDIGQAAVPDAILHKPDRLTAEEWSVVRAHSVAGADVVSRIPGLGALAPLIRAHHERWDGQGYPDGLSGPAIPLGARILAVIDAYGALTSDRPYREAYSPAEALNELRRGAGTRFDPAVVAALERVVASGDPLPRSGNPPSGNVAGAALPATATPQYPLPLAPANGWERSA